MEASHISPQIERRGRLFMIWVQAFVGAGIYLMYYLLNVLVTCWPLIMYYLPKDYKFMKV